jgi:serine/threonine protein kinase
MANTVLREFELIKKIESGGMSDIWKGKYKESKTNKFVAVKLIHNLESIKITESMFNAEVQFLQMLQGQNNIVKYIASGFDVGKQQYCIVMEWLDQSLSDFLHLHGPIYEPKEWSNFAGQLIDAIELAHSRSVAHRDIKPDNVMLRKSEEGLELVLIDFGIGKSANRNVGDNFTRAEYYTPGYTPSDFLEWNEFSRDIYSLAVLLVRLRTKSEIDSVGKIREALSGLRFESSSLSSQNLELPQKVIRFLDQTLGSKSEDNLTIGGFKNGYQNALLESGLKSAQKINLFATSDVHSKLFNRFGSKKANFISELEAGDQTIFASHRTKNGVLDRTKFYFLFKDFMLECFQISEFGRNFLQLRYVSRLSSEDVDVQRARSVEVDSSMFRFTIDPATSLQSLNQDLIALTNFIQPPEPKRAKAIDLTKQVEIWKKSIEARKEVVLTAHKPQKYFDVFRKGARLVFIIDSSKFDARLNTFWEVRGLEKNQLKLKNVSKERAEFEFFGKLGKFPKKGTLSPSLGDGKAGFSRQLAAIEKFETLDLANPKLAKIFSNPSAAERIMGTQQPGFTSSLDDAKKEAVKLALESSDISLVQGPPGTGKTKFIAELVQQVSLKAGKTARVLLVSQTHVAVDNAIAALDNGGFTSMVRVGREEKISQTVSGYMIENRLLDWKSKVSEISNIRVDKYLGENDVNVNELSKWLLVSELLDATVKDGKLNLGSESTVSSADFEGEIANPLHEGVQVASEDVDEHILQIVTDLERHGFKRNELVEQIHSGDLSRRLASYLSESKTENSLEILRIQKDWIRRFPFDSHLLGKVIARTELVAGTCIGFIGDPYLQDLHYDLCIIDEASKATATELLVPISRSKKVVLVGDDKQLSPNDSDLLRRKDLLAKYNLRSLDVQQTIFETMLVGLPDSSVSTLSVQYRMDPPIGDLISNCFYENQIINGPQTTPTEISNLLGKQIKWFDTASLGKKSFEIEDGDSFVNESEKAALIREMESIVQTIGRDQAFNSLSGSQYLVISPYSSQVANLKRSVATSDTLRPLLQTGQIRVLTIDSVQGLEADFTFFSITRANDKNNERAALGFISGEYWKRHNVALSRAKHGLFIFGNARFIQRWPDGMGDPLSYIRKHHEHCEVIEVRSVQ